MKNMTQADILLKINMFWLKKMFQDWLSDSFTAKKKKKKVIVVLYDSEQNVDGELRAE